MELLPHEKQVVEYEKTIAEFKEKNKENSLLSSSEIQKLEKRLDRLKEKIYSNLSPWERVQICRHPSRPRTVNYIEGMCEEFVELCGDRTFRDDPVFDLTETLEKAISFDHNEFKDNALC